MTRRVRGEGTCVLSDKSELTLVINFNALAEAEYDADMGVNDILAELDRDQPRMKIMRAIVWGALREKHPNITSEMVGDLLLSEFEGVAAGIREAMSAAFPEAIGGDENPPAPPSSAGTSSSKTGRRKG